MRHIEFETKALLNKSDYLKLFNQYKNVGKLYDQTNIYLDTADFNIIKKKMMLRIRIKKEQIELTLKIPLESGIEEINQNISKNEMNKILESRDLPNGEVKNKLNNIFNSLIKVEKKTELKTTRLDFNYQNALLSLDKNEYNETIDYELEVEAQDMKKSHEILSAILSTNKIIYKENLLSKSERAINHHI